jgi:hypothetical protein
MILFDPHGKSSARGGGGRPTLDDLFRRAADRHPGARALADPPNRESVTDGSPRRLTYGEADRVISALAARLHRMGLHTDSVVALQIANTVEGALALLAVMRAGMIAMPIPLLWRRADTVAALGRVGARALIVSGRIGIHDHFELARHVAAETFPIRHVCGFGRNPPDGIVPLDDLYTVENFDPPPPVDQERMRPPGPGAHLAVITWDSAPGGLIPVARSHTELVAGALAVLLESRLQQGATILTTLTLSSFAGLASGLVPWLLVGGTLVLHHPFDAAALAMQCCSETPHAVIVPGPLLGQLADAGCLGANAGLRHILGVWRAPERLSRTPAWRDGDVAITDIQAFGENVLIAARRGPSGRPAAIAFGPVMAPRGATGGVIVAEAQPTANGTIALRGPMVPRCAFPPGVERTTLPHLKIAPTGFVDTGYACWGDQDNAPMAVTAPPPGMVAVGGYRFVMRDLQDVIGDVEAGATLAALPDALLGYRLAGSAPNASAFRQMLTACGVNPLIVDAFQERRPAADSELG